MASAVIAITTSDRSAQAIVDALRDDGFGEADISILRRTGAGSADLEPPASHQAGPALASGGSLAGTLGVVAGIGLHGVVGVGPLMAAGPIFLALTGVGLGATVGGVLGAELGGVAGALVGMRIPDADARTYESQLHRGEILIAVHDLGEGRATGVREALAAVASTATRVIEEVARDHPRPHAGPARLSP